MYSLQDVIAWKYPEAKAATKGRIDGKHSIVKWEHPTIPKPTPEQIELAISEYKASQAAKKTQKVNKYKALLARLNLSQEDLELMFDLLRNYDSGIKAKLFAE